MGKPIRPADPEAEKAELRQLTRELHEAAQDARAAARELREARQTVEKTVNDTLGKMLEQVGKGIEEGMKKMDETFKNRADFEVNNLVGMTTICIDKVKTTIAEAECRLGGYANQQDLADQITSEIRESIPELAKNRDFLDDVAAAISSHMKFVLPGAAPHAGVVTKIVSPANH